MTDKTHPYGDDMSPDEVAVLTQRDAEAAAAAAGAAAGTSAGAAEDAGEGAAAAAAASTEAAGQGAAEAEAGAGAAGEKKDGADEGQGKEAGAEGEGAAAGAAADQANPDAVAAVLDEADAVRHVTYEVGDTKSMKAARDKLLAKEDELNDKLDDIRKLFDDGEITEDAFKAQRAEARQAIREVRGQSDDLLRGITSQETLATANEQAAKQTQLQVMAAIASQSKKDGLVDYGTQKAQAQFDAQLQALLADPEMASKPFSEVAEKAHSIVCMLNGFNAAAPAPAPAAAGGAKPGAAAPAPGAKPADREVPRTLAGVPAAAGAPVGSDLLTQYNALSGEDAETFLANLPAAQRANLFRSTVGVQ